MAVVGIVFERGEEKPQPLKSNTAYELDSWLKDNEIDVFFGKKQQHFKSLWTHRCFDSSPPGTYGSSVVVNKKIQKTCMVEKFLEISSPFGFYFFLSFFFFFTIFCFGFA